MKLRPIGPRGILIRLGIFIPAYAILFQIIAHTRMIESVMASTFNWWELVIIVLFLVARFATYLVIVPAILALGVYQVAKCLLTQKK